MTIIDKLVKVNKYNRPGTKIPPTRICVHYTGDVGTGADRLALFYANVAAGAFASSPGSCTSTQYIVGLNGEVIRIVPDDEMAYAAAGKNHGTIHIEVCYKQSTGAFEEASKNALRELVQYLMAKYHFTPDKVVRHYDLTGKFCPYYYVNEDRWAVLHEFITAPETKPKTLYRVQVGAFSNRGNADNYMARVKDAGFPAFLTPVDDEGLCRVQVGAFSIRANAESYMEKIKEEGFPAFIIEAQV